MNLNERIKIAVNEKLCKKGEAYRKRRMAAGEKSSAYLSGRAVKVLIHTALDLFLIAL